MIVLPNGIKIWSNEEGKLHRDDGPAMIWADGTEEWFFNGKRHRTDGPAAIWADGTEEWWLNNKKYSFQEWADKLNLDQKARLEMVMKWNPK